MNCLQGPDGDVLRTFEGTLIYFTSYLTRRVRHSAIKLYLAAVCNLYITVGYNDPLKGKLLLHKVLRGILCYQGEQGIQRQPVTPQVLLAIRHVLQSWLSPQDFSMVWAAFNLAFFAFLRCSEFTYNSVRKFRPLFDLSTELIAFHPTLACPERMAVHLKSSKTDVCRREQFLIIYRTSSTLWAVLAMREYLLFAQPQQGLLFYFQSGSFRGSSFAPSSGEFEGRRPALPGS